MSDRRRTLRHNDFLARAAFAPDDVYRHTTQGWRYIPIHPFADEDAVLRSLGLSPDACTSVDAWWEIDDDATLLQTRTASRDDPPGLWIVPRNGEERWVHLVAVLPVSLITRPSFEAAMLRFRQAGFPKERAWDTAVHRLDDTSEHFN